MNRIVSVVFVFFGICFSSIGQTYDMTWEEELESPQSNIIRDFVLPFIPGQTYTFKADQYVVESQMDVCCMSYNTTIFQGRNQIQQDASIDFETINMWDVYYDLVQVGGQWEIGGWDGVVYYSNLKRVPTPDAPDGTPTYFIAYNDGWTHRPDDPYDAIINASVGNMSVFLSAVGDFEYDAYYYKDQFTWWGGHVYHAYLPSEEVEMTVTGEINIEIFEFKKHAGLKVDFCEADEDIDLYDYFSVGDHSDAVTFSAVSTGGGSSGLSGSTFIPSSAEKNVGIQISATFEYSNGTMTIEDAFTFLVTSDDDLTFNPIPPICNSSGAVELQSYTVGSTQFSGTGVGSNEGVWYFDPEGLPEGVYTIEAFKDGCTDGDYISTTIDVEVVDGEAPVRSGFEICPEYGGNGKYPLVTDQSRGGRWELSMGVVITGNEYFFDTNIVPHSDDIIYKIKYYEDNGVCEASTDWLNVVVYSDAIFDKEDIPVQCIEGLPINLEEKVSSDQGNDFTFSVPEGASYTLTDGIYFDPSIAGSNTHTILVDFINDNGCATSGELIINVEDEVVVLAGDNIIECQNLGIINLNAAEYGTVAGNGTWYLEGSPISEEFDLTSIPSDTPTQLDYVVTSENGACSGSASRFVNAKYTPTVSLSSPEMVINAYDGGVIKTNVYLTDFGISLGGGVFTADNPAVNQIINESNYKLDLLNLVDGTYITEVTYSIASNNCIASAIGSLTIIKESGDQIEDRTRPRCGPGQVTMTVVPPYSNIYEHVWYSDADGLNFLALGSVFPVDLTTSTTFYVGLRHIETGFVGSLASVDGAVIDALGISPGPDQYYCDPVGLVDLSQGAFPYSSGAGSFAGPGVMADGITLDLSALSEGEYSYTYTYEYSESGVTCSAQASANRTVTIGTWELSGIMAYNPSHPDAVNYHCMYDGGVLQPEFDLTLLQYQPNFGIFSSLREDVTINNGGRSIDISGLPFALVTEIPLTYEVAYEVDHPGGGTADCSSIAETVLTVYNLSNNDLNAFDAQRCGSGNVILTVYDPNVENDAGFEYVWYTDREGGTWMGEGNALQTPSLNETTSYYVCIRSQVTGCEGPRKKATAFIYANPLLNIGSDVILCSVQDEHSLELDTNLKGGVWIGEGFDEPSNMFKANLVGQGKHELVYRYFDENNCFSQASKEFQVGVYLDMSAGENVDVAMYNGIGERQEIFDLNDLQFYPNSGNFSTENLDVVVDNTRRELDVSIIESGLIVDVDLKFEVRDSESGCYGYDYVSLSLYPLSNADITTFDAERCGQGELELQAYSSNNSQNGNLEIVWFDTEASIEPFFTGLTYRTTTLTATEDYYVAYRHISTGYIGPRKLITATVIEFPEVYQGGNETICKTTDPTLDLWAGVFPQGGEFIGPGVMTDGRTFDPLLSGEGSFTVNYVYNSGNCEKSFPREIIVGSAGETVSAGDPMSICIGNSVLSLSGTPSGGEWTSTDTNINSGINNATLELDIAGVSAGIYQLKYEKRSATGCMIEDFVQLEINQTPSDPIANDGYTCTNGVVSLSVTGVFSNTVQWYYNESDPYPFRAASNAYNTPSLTADETYWVDVIDFKGCYSNKVPITAHVNQPDELNIGADVFYCSDNNIRHLLTEDSSLENVVYSGRGVSGDYFVGGESEGSYLVSGTYTNPETGCSTTDTREFTIGVGIELFKNMQSVAVGDPIGFHSSLSNPRTITWEFGDGLISVEERPFHYYYEPGVYSITVNAVDQTGCDGFIQYDNFVIVTGREIDVITGVEQDLISDSYIYPNPFTGRLSYNHSESIDGPITVSVYSVQGKVVLEKTLTATGHDILIIDQNESSKMLAGIYTIRIVGDDFIKNLRTQKQ